MKRASTRSTDLPFLTREEEHDLAVRWRERGDEKAMHRLVQSHAPLVGAVLKKCRGYGMPREDLKQQGYIGLLEAAKRFEPDRGLRFATFAQFWVRAMVLDHIFYQSQLIRGPSHSAGKKAFFSGKRIPITSIDTRVSFADGTTQTIADAVPAPAVDVDAMLDLERASGILHQEVAKLNQRERKIVRARRLRDEEDCATLDSLGSEMGVSKERIRQIEAGAMQKLRQAMGAA